mgnify:CR=1 FL=1
MEDIREILRGSLERSLGALDDVDRLAAAWTVAAGSRMASRATVLGYEDGVVRMGAADETWMREMMNVKERLAAEMARLARVSVKEIRIEITRNTRR